MVAPTTFVAKMDAEGWLATEKAALIEGRWRPPSASSASNLSFEAYSRTWLSVRELKPRTRDEYAKLLDVLLEQFGPRRLDAITAESVRAWYATLDPAKATRRAHLYSLLRTIMGSALEEELIPANPCHVRGAGRTKRVRTIRPATLAELNTLVNALPERWQLMASLATWCALRFGELTELRRGDIQFTEADQGPRRAVVHVGRAVAWVDGVAIVGAPKSDAGVRDVSVPPHLVGTIDKHLAAHTPSGPNGLLFPALNGGHLNHGTFYKSFKRARAAAGRDDLRLHDLRHTGAVMAAQAGATTRELMDRLGHTTSEMAMRYQHVADGRQEEIARRLSEMAGGEA